MTINLTTLMKSIGNSIKEAQKSINHAQVKHFNMLLNSDDKNNFGSPGPVTVKVPMPNNKGAYEHKDIPVAGLMHHNALALEEVKIKMDLEACLDCEEGVKIEEKYCNPLRKIIHPKEHACQIEMVFRKDEAPEGVARVLREHLKTI